MTCVGDTTSRTCAQMPDSTQQTRQSARSTDGWPMHMHIHELHAKSV